MKRTLSLILAALLLASSMTACGKTEPKETEKSETQAVETKAPDTNPPATEAPETEAPTPSYDTSLITENGVAKAHIVLAGNADTTEQYAAEELAYHIQKVSGAEVTVTDTVLPDSLPIVIGTPATVPELETLFPDDLAWLRTLAEEDGRRYGDDGFAIRAHDGKLYIFGATARGSLNGVYDFIEENLGVLWIRASEDIGLFYDEMPTITAAKVNYREKSPFAVRSLSQYGSVGCNVNYPEAIRLYSRTRYNFAPSDGLINPDRIAQDAAVGLQSIVAGHNLKWWVITSPLYDPNDSEYWATAPSGLPGTAETSLQANIWSKKTVDTVAASVLHSLDNAYPDNPIRHVGICLEDVLFAKQNNAYPEATLPFEYAPGQFIEPTDSAYISTVFFTMLNEVARQVKEKYPDVYILTYGYFDTTVPPVCELEDNILVIYCTFYEDLSQPSMDVNTEIHSEENYKNFQQWAAKTPNLICYSYYGCWLAGGYYERPIWYRIQNDLQTFASLGITGLHPSVYYESDAPFTLGNKNWGYTDRAFWEMSMMTHWLYSKLAWNPYEDVDALIDYFCDRIYGAASDAMQEYYKYVMMGWEDGREAMDAEFNIYHTWGTNPDVYFMYYIDVTVDGIYIYDAIKEALNKAWELADERARQYLIRPIEAFADWEDYAYRDHEF